MDKGCEFFFLREKPSLALLAIEELDPAYAHKVARRIDSTFSHTSKILSQLEELGLISARFEGRIKYLYLTDRGHQVADAISNLVELLAAKDLSWKKVERIRGVISGGSEAGCTAFRIGPLRREIELFRRSGNESLQQAADEMDRKILETLRGQMVSK